MIHYTDIFGFIKSQESNYKKGVPINDAWTWSMADHIKTTELYTNSQLLRGKGEFTPVKNITRPILNLQHRTEDIELKDVQIYVDDSEKYHLSFLVKKYHDDVFVRENDLDTFFDELNVSRIDFGGGLSKRTAKGREVVPLQSIAFCDQTDMLSGPIGIKHFYSPDQLMEMESVGWGKTENGATISVEQLITLSRDEKHEDNSSETAKTPGRYIEVYEVHGNLPKRFFNDDATSEVYETRIVICAFYQKKGSPEKSGVILYTAPEKESPFKLIKRDPVYGRALGFGGAEELFEPQVWVNYDEKRMLDMKDAASKTILLALGQNSATIAQRNKIQDMDNLEIIDGADGDLKQVDTYPRNLAIFEKSVQSWEAHAQQMGAANDAIMGESPASGTPFKLQELVVQTNQGQHEYRRGQYAKHIEEIYNDDFIPKIAAKITQGAKFLSELSLEDLQYVTDCIVTSEANKKIKEMVLNGEVPTNEEIEAFKEITREQFQKKGSKHFIEVLKGEFKGIRLNVKVSVAGKSKNLAQMTDKIVNLFRFAFSNPQGFAQTMQIPGMAKSWNQILEFSGLSPADFSGIEKLADKMAAAEEPAPVEPVAPEPAYA
jgi:hypothetical protein